MKTRLIPFIIVAAVAASCSSKSIPPAKVPSVVVNTLRAQHPVAAGVEWEKHNDYYEVEFDMNDSTDVTLQIDPSGKVLTEKQDVGIAELPASIVQAVQTGYAGYRIDDVEKVSKDGSIYYQLELDGTGKKDLKLVLNGDGQVAKGIAYWD